MKTKTSGDDESDMLIYIVKSTCTVVPTNHYLARPATVSRVLFLVVCV